MVHHIPQEKNFQHWNCLKTFSESGIFPGRLKIAKVKPLYKNGHIHNVQNYRPISLLPVSFFFKIQKLKYNRLMSSVIKKNNILRRPKKVSAGRDQR
jgi:hypothetical protein